MNWILSKEKFPDNIVRLEISSIEIDSTLCPGQHIALKLEKDSKKIWLVVAEVNSARKSFFVFLQKLEPLHHRIASLNIGSVVYAVDGPYGEPIQLDPAGTVICAAEGIGIWPLFAVVKALKNAGNKVVTILGASSGEYIILENEFRKISEELIIYTDDNSKGQCGFVLHGIQEILQREKVKQVITYGPTQMIKYSSILIRRYDIPLSANLCSRIIGGKGITGIYSVAACGRSKYICVDGCDFNGYYSDFDEMIYGMKCIVDEDSPGSQNYQHEKIAFEYVLTR